MTSTKLLPLIGLAMCLLVASRTAAQERRTTPDLPPIDPDLMVGEAMLFDLETGALTRTLRRYEKNLRHVRFSPDGKRALLSFYDASVLWDVESGEVLREFDEGGIPQFPSTGDTVLIYGRYDARRYDLKTGDLLDTTRPLSHGGFKSHHSRINAHIPNRFRYDSSGELIYDTEKTGVQIILDAESGEKVGSCPNHTGWCFVAGATRRVLQGGPLHPRNVVRVFDFNQQELARFDMPAGDVIGVGGELKAVSPDGRVFLYARFTTGDDGLDAKNRNKVRLYAIHDADAGKELLRLGTFDYNHTARFSPDGRLTALVPTYAHDGTDSRAPEIIVIDNATGAVKQRLYSGPWALPSIDFDAESQRLLVAGSINFMFWRRFYEWREMEKQDPMPRKVADAVWIINDWRASKRGDGE